MKDLTFRVAELSLSLYSKCEQRQIQDFPKGDAEAETYTAWVAVSPAPSLLCPTNTCRYAAEASGEFLNSPPTTMPLLDPAAFSMVAGQRNSRASQAEQRLFSAGEGTTAT